MGNEEKVPAFTLRLGKEGSDKLAKLAKAHGRSKTWMVEALIAEFDDSPERMKRIEERAKQVG